MPNAAPRWHSGSSHNCLGRPGTWLTPVWLRCWGQSFLPAHMGHLLRRTAWTPLGPAERYWGNLASYCLGPRCLRTTALGRSWSVNLIPDSHKMLPVSYRKYCICEPMMPVCHVQYLHIMTNILWGPERPQWLKELDAPTEDMGSVPTTHTAVDNHLKLQFRWIWCSPLASVGTRHAHGTTPTQRNTYTHK